MANARSLVLLIACLLLPLLCQCQSGDPCPSVLDKPSCVCNHPDGLGVIDATSLGVQAPDAPKFSKLLDPEGYEYTLNPCHIYSEKLCTNVHSCQTSNFNPDVTYAIASGGTESMYIDPDGVPYLFYTGPGGRSVYVYLHCTDDKTPRVETDGDVAVFFEYIFNVYSRDVCPGGYKGGIAAGIAGIVVIILAICGLGVYFVVGAIVMKTQFNASGSDLIPNKAFWKSLPGLIKDGVMFTVSPCTGKILRKDDYTEIKS